MEQVSYGSAMEPALGLDPRDGSAARDISGSKKFESLLKCGGINQKTAATWGPQMEH